MIDLPVATLAVLKRIYLVTSHQLVFRGLHTIVRAMPGIEVVGETRDPDEAVRCMRTLTPDGILIASDGLGPSLLELVTHLRLSCPKSCLLIFGDQPNYDVEIELAALGVDGFLLWEDVSPEAITASLYGVLIAGVRVMSARAVDEIVAGSRRRDRALIFTEQQRLVLRGLAAGGVLYRTIELVGRGISTDVRRAEPGRKVSPYHARVIHRPLFHRRSSSAIRTWSAQCANPTCRGEYKTRCRKRPYIRDRARSHR